MLGPDAAFDNGVDFVVVRPELSVPSTPFSMSKRIVPAMA
jgi:hypothetical protein